MEYPETKRMLKDIKDGTISGLVFSKLARLARNTKELLEIAEIFRNCNADLISLAESIDTSTPAGRLFYTMIAAMAQWERDEIAERVAASIPIRAKLGKPTGGLPAFGYKWEGKQFCIDEKEAPVRRLVYELFLKTRRKRATAKELNKLGYRTRAGVPFSDIAVGRILRDPTAKGIRRANFTTTSSDGKTKVLKDKSEWVELPCPPIVSEELWENCNTILDQIETKRGPHGPRTVFLLAGFITCSCGEKMYVYHSNPVYRCKKCNRKIAASDIDEIYHEQLKSFFLTEADVDSIALKSNTILLEKEALLQAVTADYTKARKRADDLVNLRVGGEMQRDDFMKYYTPIQEQVRQFETQLPVLEAEIDFLKIQHLSADTVQQDARDLYNNWPNLSFEEKRAIIETITERIVIHDATIDIALSYLPVPHLSLKDGKRQPNVPEGKINLINSDSFLEFINALLH